MNSHELLPLVRQPARDVRERQRGAMCLRLLGVAFSIRRVHWAQAMGLLFGGQIMAKWVMFDGMFVICSNTTRLHFPITSFTNLCCNLRRAMPVPYTHHSTWLCYYSPFPARRLAMFFSGSIIPSRPSNFEVIPMERDLILLLALPNLLWKFSCRLGIRLG